MNMSLSVSDVCADNHLTSQRRLQSFCAAAAVLSFLVSGAAGQLYNTHMGDESAPWTNPTPVDNNDATRQYDWPNPPWSVTGPAQVGNDGTTINGSIPGDHVIRGGGQYRSFGMDNWFIDEDWVKTFCVEFDFVGGVPQAAQADDAAQGGVHPVTGFQGQVNDTFVSEAITDSNNDGVDDHYKLTWEFDPQPDWEYVTIVNIGSGPMTISNTTMKSTCVPTPATTVLLMSGTLLVGARRRLSPR